MSQALLQHRAHQQDLSTPAGAEPGSAFNWLPGELWAERGSAGDYDELATLHYRASRPATWCEVVAIRHRLPHRPVPVLAAVGVLSWPTAVSATRSHVFGLDDGSYGDRIAWANRHIRTISRVIIRPSHRGAGLASAVVRELVRRCPTRYIEATARMADCHPFFERGGLTRIDLPDRPPYFWADANADAGEGDVGD